MNEDMKRAAFKYYEQAEEVQKRLKEAYRRHNLTEREADILLHAYHNIKVSEFSEKSRAIGELERMKLLEYSVDKDDARKRGLALTVRGKITAEEVLEEIVKLAGMGESNT